MQAVILDAVWETLYAPYDQQTYRTVLGHLRADDVVLDIGAGDLRLTRQMARIVKKVYAVEIYAALLDRADPLPANVVSMCADARMLDFPSDITTGVLLMRHCTCFRLYAEKLRKAGASRLITNARWRMDVEVLNLQAKPKTFAETGMGWYACLCGRTGFKEGPVEEWTPEMDKIVQEVSGCPQCM
jgi:hypothetical protein